MVHLLIIFVSLLKTLPFLFNIVTVVFDFFFVKAFIIEYAFLYLLLASELSISLHSIFLSNFGLFIFFLILLFNPLYSCKLLLFWDFSDLRLSQSWRISSVIRGLVFFLLNPITFVTVSFIIQLRISVGSSELIILYVNLFLISFSIVSLYWARIKNYNLPTNVIVFALLFSLRFVFLVEGYHHMVMLHFYVSIVIYSIFSHIDNRFKSSLREDIIYLIISFTVWRAQTMSI